jgi:hypothetical protein
MLNYPNRFLGIVFLFFISLTSSSQVKPNLNIRQYLPVGYVIFDSIYGDLNNDQIEDCILIIKGTDSANLIDDDIRGKLDRNRRGIIVLFNKNNQYEIVSKNYQCFSSENEDGGVYYPPELSIEIKKNKMYVHYEHGRYGYWQYVFRYQQNDFHLIGFDEGSGGPIAEREVSINYLTKKMQEKVNVNKRAKGGDEIFKETWKSITVTKLTKLSEVEDFDQLEDATL